MSNFFPSVIRCLAGLCLGILLVGAALQGTAQVNVLTYHNDEPRTGWNTNETVLTPVNVSKTSFGQVFFFPVDGYVYAQPLILSGVDVPGDGIRNLVFVATQHDSLYAFDADDGNANPLPIWHRSFIDPANGVTSVPTGDVGSGDIVPEIGITSTPVIDASTGTIYVEAKTKEVKNGIAQYIHRLHAIDVATGAEKLGGPVVIQATVKGTGDGNDAKGNVPFNGLRQMNRPGLALVNGIIYIAFASHGDNGPYHGWVLGYNADSLTQSRVYNTTPNGGLAGIWMAGAPPASDPQGNLYAITGNGTFNTNSTTASARSYGDSFLKLTNSGSSLIVADYFAPFNQDALNSVDADLGSGGALVLPDSVGSALHPHLLVGCGKEGKIYLLDRDNMGHFSSVNDNAVVQSVAGAISGTWSMPAYYKGRIYYQGSGDVLKGFKFSGGKIVATPFSKSATGFGFPGATPTISSSGDSNGIVWVLQTDAYGSQGPTVLHAYDAENLGKELYNSGQSGSRDVPGGAVKFTLPTVANGKVYVGAVNRLAVYGLGSWVADPLLSPPGQTFTSSVSVSITDSTPGAAVYYTTDATIPTTASTPYTGPIILTNTTSLKVRAFKAGLVPSGIVSALYFNANSIGKGKGLKGDYYSNQNKTFTGVPSLTRVDTTIDFDWGNGSPDPKISADTFTARWTGTVQAQFSETYTFHTISDDGTRLWVNNQLVVDSWIDQGPTEHTGDITLEAGKRYDIKLEFYENGGGAVMRLLWSSLSTPTGVIPMTQLYAPTPPPIVSISSPTASDFISGPATLLLSATASQPSGSIATVSFYSGKNLLGTVSTPPYSLLRTNVPVGTFALTAVATDGAGISATSSVVNIAVNQGVGARFGMETRPVVAPYLNLPNNASSGLPAHLSETGAFQDLATLAPMTGLIRYAPNVAFWSDHAVKTRWVAIPNAGPPFRPDQQVHFSPTGEWVFPAGTVFVKHFDLPTDDTDPSIFRRLETRLLVRAAAGGLFGATYRWREDVSDADLITAATTENITIKTTSGVRTQAWYFPSPTDCLTCHTPNSGGTLGLNTRQLNGDLHYPGSGETDNQLRAWNHVGLFDAPVDESRLPSFTHLRNASETAFPLEARARAYLDVNCAYCHRPGGVRSNFDTRYETDLAAADIINGPMIADLGNTNNRVVVPGAPAHSGLYLRSSASAGLLKMPPLARNEVDTEGVALIRDWIDSLAGPAPTLLSQWIGNQLLLSWPVAATNAHLETTETLSPPSWHPVSGETTNGGSNSIPVNILNGQQYFRLNSQQP